MKYEIETTRQTDSGSYVCSVKSKYGYIESKPVKVEISPSPSLLSDIDPSITSTAAFVATENEEISIPCLMLSKSNDGTTQMKWFLNDKQIDIDNVHFKVSIILVQIRSHFL